MLYPASLTWTAYLGFVTTKMPMNSNINFKMHLFVQYFWQITCTGYSVLGMCWIYIIWIIFNSIMPYKVAPV